MTGLSRDIVQIVPYQSCWADSFRREADRLRSSLGPAIGRIEHVGSTSIPGMSAKPVIDMMAAIEKLSLASVLIPVMERLGYEHRPNNPVPDRLFFALGPPSLRTHYLSLAETGSPFWREQIAFRDYLAVNPAIANDYAALKQRLATQFARDRASYTVAKNGFVRNILSTLGSKT